MSGLRYRTWGAAMKHFAALDVSLKQTSVCIVDDAGGIVREAKVATEPDDLRTFFRGTGLTFERIGLEAGPLSQWLHASLTMARRRSLPWPAALPWSCTPCGATVPSSGGRAAATWRRRYS